MTGDSISSVDKAADNYSSVCTADIAVAADAASGSPDAGRATVQAGRSTGNMAGLATGPGLWPRLAAAGRPTRSRRKPARFLDLVAASLPPIGRCVARYRIVSHVACRLVFARMHNQPVALTRTCPNVGIAVSAVHMSKKRSTMSDVELSSSEGEQMDSDRGGRLTQEIDDPETVAKRITGSLAPPVPADVRFDANGGAYVRRRPTPRTGGASAIPEGQRRCRGPSRWPRPDKKEFRHQRCRLCDHDHVFETRSCLNSHAVLQHVKYYYLRRIRRLCFRCGLFVCLFVCLSVGLLANL